MASLHFSDEVESYELNNYESFAEEDMNQKIFHLLCDIDRKVEMLQKALDTSSATPSKNHFVVPQPAPKRAIAPRKSALIGSDELRSFFLPETHLLFPGNRGSDKRGSNQSNDSMDRTLTSATNSERVVSSGRSSLLGVVPVMPNTVNAEPNAVTRVSTLSDKREAPAVPPLSPSTCSAAGWISHARLTDSNGSVLIQSALKNSHSRMEAIDGQQYAVLAHNGPVKLFWNIFMLVVTVVVGMLVPTTLAYWGVSGLSWGSGSVAVYTVIDVALVTDVIIKFRTSFQSNNGVVIADAYSIALRYLQTWGIANLLAAWPTILFPRSVIIVPLVLKLLRVLELHSLITSIQDFVRHVNLTWLKVVLSVTIAVHTMACAWRGVQQAHDPRETDQADWVSLYTVDIYWVVMTITTVGYGDIQVIGNGPRVFATACMVFGAVVFGFMLSFVSAGMKRILDDDIGKTLTEVKGFLRFRKISPELQVRVERNIRDAMVTERREILRPDIFSKLSLQMQMDLSLELLSDVILPFPLFLQMPKNFVAEIARAHIWVRALQGDVVVESGQVVQELIFIVQGAVLVEQEVEVVEQKTNSLSSETLRDPYEMHTGAWLGESCLFNQDVVRDYSALAVKNSELAVLTAESYHKIKENYPRVVTRYNSLQKGLEAGELDLQGLSYNAQIRLTLE